MRRRTFLLGSTATFASAGLLTGTGAFTSTEGERGIDVDVADDERALLALTTDENGEGTVDTHGLLDADEWFHTPQKITIENQLTHAVPVRIETDDDVTDPDSIEADDLGPGETETIEIDLPENGEVDANLHIIAGGDADESTAIVVTRSLKLQSYVPEFAGNGDAFLHPEGLEVEVLALYGRTNPSARVEPDEAFTWNTSDDNQFKHAAPSTLAGSRNESSGASGQSRNEIPGESNQPQNAESDGNPSEKLLALYFEDRDLVYHNPRHDPEDIEFPDEWPRPSRPGEKRGE